VEDGTLEIDNNLIENAIRPSALGKKTYCFSDILKLGNAARRFILCWVVADGTASIHLIT
jgi:hypothetical protein